LRVHSENTVEIPEKQVQRLLNFVNVPFEKSCLNSYRTDRSIRTPSSEQVRQSIYKSGLEQWRNFEPFLDVLKDHLSVEILSYPAWFRAFFSPFRQRLISSNPPPKGTLYIQAAKKSERRVTLRGGSGRFV